MEQLPNRYNHLATGQLEGNKMAGTTPNYGFPYPTSTDYVRDGATAIESLADAIDAFVSDSEASNKLFDRVQSVDQNVTSYSRSVSNSGFVTLNAPTSLTYSVTLGKSGVALVSFGGNISGTTAGVLYFVGLDISGGGLTGFNASQARSIICTGSGRGSGASTVVVDGTPGATITIAVQGKSNNATGSTVTLNDHYLTVLLLG